MELIINEQGACETFVYVMWLPDLYIPTDKRI